MILVEYSPCVASGLCYIVKVKSLPRVVRNWNKRLTMKGLGLLQEPFQPTSTKPKVCQFLESASLIYARIVCELRSFDQREYDRVL
jgi:hypothetical protein